MKQLKHLDLSYCQVKLRKYEDPICKQRQVKALTWVLDNSNFLFFYHLLLFRFRHNGSTTISWQNTDNWRMTH